MDKTYQPHSIEPRWINHWQQHHFAKPSNQGDPYCIMLPPPNVTGTLHMGHGFQHTLMDALIRRQRMQAKNTLWQAGTDHAGIATQMVVERQLAQEGKSRQDIGRDAFMQRVWQWREQSGNTITQQIRLLGNSLDWTRERFSMDEQMSHATYEAFLRLHQEGLIYRGKRLVNWDPKLLTAISDLEVTSELRPGHLWHLRYPLANSETHIIVATTRPETMLGDTAIAVHPEDPRYQHLIGQSVRLPLANRDIPIVADEHVDPEFGSGCVKITPGHDFNDYDIGKRHDLPMINIFTPEAIINDNAPAAYQGLDRFAARKKVIADLEALALIEKIEDHQISIPKGDRSGAIIEPRLTDQWYISMKQLAQPAIDAVKNGTLRFTPSNWTKTYLQWLENIQDWCISRQLWWGHQIPVWYDDQGQAYVGHDENDVRQRHQLPKDLNLTQDPDVLDTWFTASLHPFATLGWPEKTPDLSTFYPSNVLVTGFDIIFFWVARMVMMGLKLAGDVPFREVYITGLIRDSQGKKMSKTKGNILDPLDIVNGIGLEDLLKKRTVGLMQPQMAPAIELATRKEFPNGIEAYGADALRFTFCALANTGRDINFDMGRIGGYRNFCNKLWNASRYVLMTVKDDKVIAQNSTSLADRWIQSCLQRTMKTVNTAFDDYRFDLIAQALYEFTWNEYCDWYLELSKCILNNPETDPQQQQATQYTLIHTLETLLRLMHPLMPFITEEIWQTVAVRLDIPQTSIMIAPYPSSDDKQIDQSAEGSINWLKQVVSAIRNIRSETGISPAKKINMIFSKGQQYDIDQSQQQQHDLKTLARIDNISWLQENQQAPTSATAVVNDLVIHVPLADLIDKTAELTRLRKEISKLTKEQEKSANKLKNESYLAKAPEAVVEKEKQRHQKTIATLEKLQQHYAEIESIPKVNEV